MSSYRSRPSPRVALLPGTTLAAPTYARVLRGLTETLPRLGWHARCFCPRRSSMNAMESFGPDVLHLHFSGHLGAETRRWLDSDSAKQAKLILTFQDLDHPDLPPLSSRERRLVTHLLANASRVTALTPDLAAAVHRRYQNAAHGISVIGNGVGREWFHTATTRRDSHCIVAASRLAPYKGIDLLLWAFRGLSTDAPQARLNIFGKDFQSGRFQDLSRRLGLQSRVRFTANASAARLGAALNAARIFVSASRRETYGMAVLEALAAGTPVLATRTGMAASGLRHGREAWLVPPGDPAALERGLRRLWSDATLRRRLGAAGRRAARCALWERRAQEYVRLYTAALCKDRGAKP